MSKSPTKKKHALTQKARIMLNILDGWSPNMAASLVGVDFPSTKKYLLEDAEFSAFYKDYLNYVRTKPRANQYFPNYLADKQKGG